MIDTLREFLDDQTLRLYDAENQIHHEMNGFAEKASNRKLKSLLERYADLARQHALRTEITCQDLGLKPLPKHCTAITALLADAWDRFGEEIDRGVRDAVLITEIQRIVHYQIALYGGLRSYAGLVGNEELAVRFQEALDEEKEVDKQLSRLALKEVNRNAAAYFVMEQGVGELQFWC